MKRALRKSKKREDGGVAKTTARGSRANPKGNSHAQSAGSSKPQAGRRTQSGNKNPLLIVGVGASAGGLEAFTEFLKALPPDTGLAFILVQHLDPEHESSLPMLLTRASSMPVLQAADELRVRANHVYVIPPSEELTISQGLLRLRPRPQGRTLFRSIDRFFESLARDRREHAVGVILSGTATDGTVGLEAIKAEGGITFAQDDSARHSSMPRSAIAAGCVDFVLKPGDIARELVQIATHPRMSADDTEGSSRQTAHEADGKAPGPPDNDGFKKVLQLLRNHSGVDFSLYKATTIRRRVLRRMALNKHGTYESYARFIHDNTPELNALYSDALINVTSFFRNPEAFDVLKRKVFPRLLKRNHNVPIRVWVLGCSTGQEAYSVAMALVEAANGADRSRSFQIFATDLNESTLERARQGLYPQALCQDISPVRLRRFFVDEESGYRVSKALREMVVFARQNLITDPPFSRMDLIICRNVLIYLEPSLQKKAIPTFHYALRPDGFLFLGASESIGTFTELFEPVDKKHKIYSRKPGPLSAVHLLSRTERVDSEYEGASPPNSGAAPSSARRTSASLSGSSAGRVEMSAEREADRVTVNQFAPPGVLVNAGLQILQFRGQTGAYLQPPPSGKASFDLLKMAREGLMLPLRAAINKARRENKTVRKDSVSLTRDGHPRLVNLEVIPLKNLRERCFLVLFGEAKESHDDTPAAGFPAPVPDTGHRKTKQPARPDGASLRVASLEGELTETRDYLQSVQEQYEAANEELQASNEEVQSANEELQSVNEELETSKEELESANEELMTVNEEMSARNAELSRLNADLHNLHANANMPILVVARDLVIRQFTNAAQKMFSLMATDVGRPLKTIRHNLMTRPEDTAPPRPGRRSKSSERDTPSVPLPLEAVVKRVIDSVTPADKEVQDETGHWFALRVRPYMTLDNRVDGALLVLVDIDAVKRNERIQTSLDFAQKLVDTIREPLLVLDAELRIRSAGGAFYRTFKVSPEETIGRYIYELGNRQWDIPRLRALLQDILPEQQTLEDFEVQLDFEHLGHRVMLVNARQLDDPAGKSQWILLAVEDITDRKLHAQESERARLVESVLSSTRDALLILGPDLRVEFANETYYRTFKASRAETEGRFIYELGDGQWNKARLRQLLGDILPRNSFFDSFEITHDVPAAGQRTMVLSAKALADPTGSPRLILLDIQDVTEVLHYQANLRRSELRYRRLFEAARDGVLIVDPQGRNILDANPYMTELLGCSREEMLNRTLDEIGLFANKEETSAFFQQLLAAGFVRLASISPRTTSGRQLEVEMVSNAYRENGGMIIQCNIRDITERRETERALVAAREQLADRAGALENAVAERTSQLREMVGELEAFSYGITHDLRAPLRALRSFSRILERDHKEQLDEGGREYLNRINTSAARMDTLIQDVLTYSKVLEMDLRLAPVDVKKLLRDMLDSYPEYLESKAEITLEGEFPLVMGNQAALTQCFSNLLNNAIKFVPPETRPVVRVTAARDGPRVRFTVADNGVGIEPSYQSRIFDMFERLDTSYEGTGIGLAIVRKAAERMGGKIGVESEPGKGSRFWIDLAAASIP